jgi:hypothetical protein
MRFTKTEDLEKTAQPAHRSSLKISLLNYSAIETSSRKLVWSQPSLQLDSSEKVLGVGCVVCRVWSVSGTSWLCLELFTILLSDISCRMEYFNLRVSCHKTIMLKGQLQFVYIQTFTNLHQHNPPKIINICIQQEEKNMTMTSMLHLHSIAVLYAI